MSRVGKIENVRVEVEPEVWWVARKDDPKELIRAAEEVAASIRRHVDHTSSVRVMWATVQRCEHCGSQWTEDDADYNGGCCDADQGAWGAAHPEEVVS